MCMDLIPFLYEVAGAPCHYNADFFYFMFAIPVRRESADGPNVTRLSYVSSFEPQPPSWIIGPMSCDSTYQGIAGYLRALKCVHMV